MTRRELARHLARDVMLRGQHFEQGSTVWCTPEGEWGAYAGQVEPYASAAFYAWIGWDRTDSDRATIFKIETQLKKLECERTGYAKRVERKSLRVGRWRP